MTADEPDLEPPEDVPAYITDPLDRQGVETLRDVRDWIDDLIDARSGTPEYHEVVQQGDRIYGSKPFPVARPKDVEPEKRDRFGPGRGRPSWDDLSVCIESRNCDGCKSCPHGPYIYGHFYDAGEIKQVYLGVPLWAQEDKGPSKRERFAEDGVVIRGDHAGNWHVEHVGKDEAVEFWTEELGLDADEFVADSDSDDEAGGEQDAVDEDNTETDGGSSESRDADPGVDADTDASADDEESASDESDDDDGFTIDLPDRDDDDASIRERLNTID